MVRGQRLSQVQGESVTPRITIELLRRNDMCSMGARRWFIDYGLDFERFLKEGIDIETVRKLDDAYGNRAVEFAEKGM